LTVATVHHAALAVVLTGAAGVVAGAVYAAVDRRLALGPRAVRSAGRATAAAAVVAAAVGVGVFLLTLHDPGGWFGRQWHAFKHRSPETGTTHLTALGSNRYDFWRVSVQLFEDHPLDGCGARCFGPEYLIRGRSEERPVRAHS